MPTRRLSKEAVMTRTASRLGNSETGPPRTRAATLHQVPRALALGAVLAASATVMAFSAPTVAAPMGNATKTLLSIVDASVSPAAVASLVTREGGTVLATYDVADTLLVSLPTTQRLNRECTWTLLMY